jgi:MATE family multidrug resistance protein
MEERTPLLPEWSSVTPSSEITTVQDAKISYIWELKHLAAAAAPISLSFATQNVVQACSIMVAGKIGTFELGVASYGYMFASCTGSMVAIGGSTAIDTLCAQAFNPETPLKNSQVLGTILHRGLLVLSLLFVLIITPIWWYSQHLFVALGQDEEFAKATCKFLQIMIPGGLLQVVSECLKKFLQVQQNSYAVGWITAITSILGAFANIVLINSSLGLWGAPVANAVYNTSNVLCLLLYVWYKPDLAGAMITTMAIFEDLVQFSILAMTGILTVATEWWG